jgi:hypothetical protein
MPNQTIIIRFDGNYFSYTDDIGNLFRIPAISGKIDSQSSQLQNLIERGPIPEGFYDVKQDEYQSIGFTNIFAGLVGWGGWPKSIPAWGTERIWLQPQFPTNTYGRDGFTIHGGWTPESSGCIDLVNNASTFFSFFKSLGSDAVLQVDYGSGYDGSNNPLTNGINSISIEEIYSSKGLDLSELEPLKFLQNQVKSQLEQQLQMSIPEQSINDIIKSYNFTESSELTNLMAKYNLSSDLSSLASITPSLIINDGQGNNFNLLAFPNFSNLTGVEQKTAWDGFTNSFLETALLPLNQNPSQFTDFLNQSRISFSEFGVGCKMYEVFNV